jgi:hypothetical protein
LIRNEDEFKRLLIEIIADTNTGELREKTGTAAVEGLSQILHSHRVCVPRKVELYLGVYEEGTTFKIIIYWVKIDVDHVFCHAVMLGTILSIFAQSV